MQVTLGLGLRTRFPLASAPPPFTPADITGLALWLDGADLTTITHTSGSISQWSDKSGNGYHAIQGTGANQPVIGSRTINGLNVIDFDGIAHRMALPSGLYSIPTGASTFFFVGALDNPSAVIRMVSGSNGNSRYGVSANIGTANSLHFVSSTSNTAAANASLTRTLDTNPFIIAGKRSGTSQSVWDNLGNTATNTSGANFTMNSFVLGRFPSGSGDLDGVMAEILIYTSALSNSDINIVGAYLAAKWGLLWTNI